jgi:tricorn protease-like protein
VGVLSPDGNRIAGSFNGKNVGEVRMFDLASGKLQPFVQFTDKFIARLAWAPDGRWIYMTHTTRGERVSDNTNIGAVSFPNGKFRDVTADTTYHYGVFLTADGKPWRQFSSNHLGHRRHGWFGWRRALYRSWPHPQRHRDGLRLVTK